MLTTFNSLKEELKHTLENNGFFNAYGIDGPIRGSKICSLYIYKKDEEEFKKLYGIKSKRHQFWFSKSYEVNDSIKYSVNCVKI